MNARSLVVAVATLVVQNGCAGDVAVECEGRRDCFRGLRLVLRTMRSSVLWVMLPLVSAVACDDPPEVQCEGRPLDDCRQVVGEWCAYTYLLPGGDGCFERCEPKQPACDAGRECAEVTIDSRPELAVITEYLCVPPDSLEP
jgi:hypothetical protein